jgi:very-short-patch-repair endonuclease
MRRDKWELLFSLAEVQHAAFTTPQAAELGIDSNTLARARRDRLIDRLRPNVHAVLSLIDDDTVMAGIQLAHPRSVGSHTAAAAKHGFDGIERVGADVLVPRNVRLRGTNAHHVDDLVVPEIVVIDGLRYTDEVRTLCDLAAVESLDVVERAVESLLRRRPGALDLLVDRATALRRRGKTGPAGLLEVLERRPDVASESDLETVYWQGLREHGVELPVRQHVVGSYRLDLAYPPERLFVELDGWGTHGSWEAFGADRRRQNEVVLLGWAPLRFTDSDVRRFMRRTARITAETLRRRRALLAA